MLSWIFLKNNKSLEHLNVLLRIFFASGVFQNFDVHFWPLLKAEKVLAPKQFWRENFFSSKFYFLSSIWIYKLSASRITENSSHCYTLTIRGKTKGILNTEGLPKSGQYSSNRTCIGLDYNNIIISYVIIMLLIWLVFLINLLL